VLDRLKHDPETRHIPVQVISVDERSRRGMRLGAFTYLKKPVSRKALDDAFASVNRFLDRKVRTLLVVEDNELERSGIVDAIGDGDVVTTAVGDAAAALSALRDQTFDCMVLDLNLPDRKGLALLEEIKSDPRHHDLRVVVYTGRDLTRDEETRLEEMAETTIIKDARSIEYLVEKTSLFLHRIEANLKHSTRKTLQHAQRDNPTLAGKRVLIVDDDVRNIFALTSTLERWGIAALRAENGAQALETLREHPEIDLVLMDIMMPGMDGYETMRAIRDLPQFQNLPIIALTAKAMKEDRRKCMDAGASDYLAKPASGDQLSSMLRVWLQDRPAPRLDLDQ
jgi:CheY-like chemotaxis protein